MLALAAFCVLGVEFASATPGGSAANLETTPPTHPKRSSTVKSTTHKTSVAHRTRHHSRVASDPWHMTSYGNPAVEDNPAGEDPLIRQAALDALGRLSGSIVVVDPNT